MPVILMLKILITGGAGFIGSHIADLFIKNNHDVIIMDNLANGNKNNINSKAKFYEADILDNLDEIFKKEKFDVLIHNAALVDANESISKPKAYEKVNVKGTVNLLEYCRKFNVKKFIYASSNAVYGNPEYLPCDEKHPTNPINPYGKTKLEAENKIIDYSNKYGVKYTILRYGNVYGPRQDPIKGGVIIKFLSRIMNNKNPIIFGDGTQTRDFLFVEDAALATLLALETNNKIFNIASGKQTSINELLEEMKKLFDKKIKIQHSKALKEIKNTYLDISLAKKVLQWNPKTELSEGIKRIIQFTKTNSNL
jgi:UDP-glucose 4-epimerase